MNSIAHPRRRRPPTSLTTPRSTSEITGISGSGISASASQTALGGHHCAPGRRAAHHRHLLPQLARARPRAAPRSTASASGSSQPSARSTRRAARARSSVVEHAERVRPQLLERLAQPLAALLRASSRSTHSSACMRWYASSRSIFAASPATSGVVGAPSAPRSGSRRPSRRAVARDRPRPVEDAAARRAARSGTPPARGRTRARPRRPELARGQLVERPRVADLVLRDRRERDVLLEERRDPRPLGVAPAEDQLVVGELEQQVSSAVPARSRASFSRALIE